MFLKVSDFITEWKNEEAATQQVMDALTDVSLKQEVAPNHRTLGHLAWHIVQTMHEMLSKTGLEFYAPEGEVQAPATAAEIAQAYRRTGQAMQNAIKSQWIDETLVKTSSMYGETWSNGLTLRILIQHEIHHRGQMTILMRQAGLRVPEIYGPTREGWLERGMQPLM